MSVKLFPRKSTRKCALQKVGPCVSEKLRIYQISMNIGQEAKKIKGLVNTYSLKEILGPLFILFNLNTTNKR